MGMKLKMNERRVRSEELPLRNSESRCGPAPSGNDLSRAIAKGRKMDSARRERSGSKAQLLSHNKEKTIFPSGSTSRQHKQGQCVFFCLIRVCYSVKSHKQRLSLYLYTHKQEQNWLSWQCFLHKIEEFKFSGLLLLLFFRVWTLCLEFGSDNRVHFGSSHPEKCIKHSGLLICATLFSPAEMINVWFKMYLGYTA